MDVEPDRRIRRTRRALTDALISLTSEHPYRSIQVRDITDRADVGYATFYRHYESKDDLMLAIFAEISVELEFQRVSRQGNISNKKAHCFLSTYGSMKVSTAAFCRAESSWISSRSYSPGGSKITFNVTQGSWVSWRSRLNWRQTIW